MADNKLKNKVSDVSNPNSIPIFQKSSGFHIWKDILMESIIRE